MTQTITGLFDHYDDARRAVQDLEAAGVAHRDISIVGHDKRDDENGADCHARLGQRDDDVPQHLPAGGAGIARGLDQRAIDAHQRVEDRRYHEQRVEMHHGQHDGKF